jgi:hypothetical protein
MTLPITPKKPINKEIYDILETYFMEMIEVSEEAKAVHERWTELLAQIEGKVPLRVYNAISDMFFTAACHYGNEMFRLGIMIGREPEVILDLPDSSTEDK